MHEHVDGWSVFRAFVGLFVELHPERDQSHVDDAGVVLAEPFQIVDQTFAYFGEQILNFGIVLVALKVAVELLQMRTAEEQDDGALQRGLENLLGVGQIVDRLIAPIELIEELLEEAIDRGTVVDLQIGQDMPTMGDQHDGVELAEWGRVTGHAEFPQI